jgi:uncharacterized membrane protein
MTDGDTTGRRIGRWLLILFYGVAGVMHWLATAAMVRIVPAWVPAPHAVVLITGLCEVAGAIGLMTPRWRRAAGWGLAAYALCVWPANVKHAIDDLSHGTGLPIWYHAPRLLLQPAIIYWALWAGGIVGRRAAPGARRRG